MERGRLQTGIWLLSFVTLVGLFIVNIVGFVDTETGSAYGCGHQWPLCNGSVIPSVWGLHTLIEFMHRGLVGVVTILLLTTSFLAWRYYGRWIEVKALILIAVGFVFLEAFLGAMGVLFSDPPPILALHFGVSLVAFNGVFLLSIVLRQIRRRTGRQDSVPVLREALPDRRFMRWVWFTVAYVYVAMYFGAYVSSSGAGSMFRGWPLPTERYGHVHSALFVDILHRLLALGLVVLTLWLCIWSHRMRGQRPDLYRSSLLLLILVCSQAVSGALLIITHMNLNAFLVHVVIVTFLFSTICYLGLQVLPEPERKLAPEGASLRRLWPRLHT